MFFEKKGVKKIFILALFAIALCLPIFVFSQGFGMDQTATKAGYDSRQTDIYVMIANVVRIGFGVMAFIFFGLTLYAGLCWLTARGKEELIERAKATMEQAIIGLIIVSLSYALTSFVMDRFSQTPSSDDNKTTTPVGTETPTEKPAERGCCVFGQNDCMRIFTTEDTFECTDNGGDPQNNICDEVSDCGGTEDPGNPFGDGNAGA